MSRLTRAALPALSAWLTEKRPLGFSLTQTQIAVAASDGTSWVSNLGHDEFSREILTMLGNSGRRIWSEMAGRAAIRLARTLNLEVGELDWMSDVTTARNVVYPGVPFTPNNRGAALNAVAAARFMVGLTADAPLPTRDAVLSSCAQEKLWRPRQARGWRVDVALLERELAAATTAQARARAELGFDMTDTSTASGSAAIHEWLARVGIAVVDRNNNPSLVRDNYDKTVIPKTPEAAQAWATFRRVRSIASRIGKLREIKAALRGDRIFSTVFIRSTRTGRGTVVKPALQNINRDLRPLLIADEGRVLCSLDFEQVEPRVLAALAGDTAMAAALEAGDIYAELAKTINGPACLDAEGIVTAEARAQAKAALLGILYGKGIPAIASSLGVDRTRAKWIIDSMWDAYPGLRQYVDGLRADMIAGTPDLTPDGRPLPRVKELHVILNHRIQSSAADVFYQAIARVAAHIPTDYLFLGIHDELVLSVPAGRTEFAKRALAEMNTVFHGIPIRGQAVELGIAWKK
ncbi:DNA polymerase family A [Rhodoglobus vestalii]|uniref:DNA-directed DNA polymerase n=1 Tax=Rhodoglobus vestalii TaxID=193384 RepID=A0A8H2K902_9MICO|nr:DNA polymerase [Rhodoglobus vestalii]TQO21089.1 DNA polymerase family A [Rhodoglobus vestalii]